MFRFSAVALVIFAIVAGCNGRPTTTSSVVATPAPTGATPATAPTSGSTTAATSSGDGWRLLTDFPVNGAAQVNSIAVTDSGFVAVGTAADLSAACEADTNHGRVWTSVDGVTWTSQPDETFTETDLTSVVVFKGAIYAIGSTGTLDTETACASPTRQAGINVWRSADRGVSWQQLPQSAVLSRATVAEVIVATDKLLAVGSDVNVEGNENGATWTSTDGQTWSPAELPPGAPDLATAVAKTDVIVGFGDDQDFPLPWISRDGGQHWYEESVDVAGADASALSLSIEDVVATSAGYVAAGNGCCLGAAQLVPIVFTTPNGTQWQGTIVPADKPQQMRRLAHLGTSGLLAAGIQTYVDNPTGATDLGGRSWVSADDGATWQAGPAFPELGDGNVTALAVGPAGAVVAGASVLDESAAAGDTGLRVWFAPLSAFGAAASH